VWLWLEPVLEHWLTSGLSGLLAFYSTSTICRSWFSRGFPSAPTTSLTTPADRCIGRLSWAVGFTVSIASHLCIDYGVGHSWLR